MLVFFIEEADFLSKIYTYSLSAGMPLGKIVEFILGKPANPGFDLQTLVGTQLQLIVVHNENSKGLVRANIAGVLKPRRSQRICVPDKQRGSLLTIL